MAPYFIFVNFSAQDLIVQKNLMKALFISLNIEAVFFCSEDIALESYITFLIWAGERNIKRSKSKHV